MRSPRALVVLLCTAALAGCAAPDPATVAGDAARLDPEVGLYDTVEFRTDRELPFTGEQVCQQLQSLQEFALNSKCGFDLPGDQFGTFALEANEFRLFWLGGASSFYRGFAHTQRGILLDRYHSVELVDAAFLTRPCTVVVDVGSPQALSITVSPSRDVADALGGEPLALADALDLCATATATVEELLTTFDPDGGSVTG